MCIFMFNDSATPSTENVCVAKPTMKNDGDV